MEDIFRPPRLDVINLNNAHSAFVLRDDLIHPYLSGNKWRKLKYNLRRMISEKKDTIITFGGAFSNHLAATAAAGKIFGFSTIGIVRGDAVENHRIRFMRECGMKLSFVSREEYRKKNEIEFQETLLENLLRSNLLKKENRHEWIPEGGSNSDATIGTSEINAFLPDEITTIFCACGTGGTAAGISTKLLPHQKVVAVSVLKGGEFLVNEIEKLGGKISSVDFLTDYHFGGYAKYNDTLLSFCADFSSETSIPVEPIYTGKLFFAVNDRIKKGFISPKEKIAIIHTGGIFPIDRNIE